MDCHTVRDLSVAYLEGELPPSEAIEVRRHLTHCAACRRQGRLLGRQEAVLSRLSPPPELRIQPPGFWDRMDRALAEEAERSLTPAALAEPCWRKPIRISPLGALAYAAALVLAFSWGWLQQKHADRAIAEAEGLHAELEQERRLAAQPPEPIRAEQYRPVSHPPRRGTF